MTIEVAPRKFIDVQKNPPNLPEFQRGKVWDDEQKFELVMSAFLGYPVGAFSIHIDSEGEEWLLDGQQRLDAIENMFIPSNVYNWAMGPKSMALASTSPYHSLTPGQKEEHLTVTLSYLGYRWIRKIYDDTHKMIEDIVKQRKGNLQADREYRFHERMRLRKVEVERIENELHLFKPWNDGTTDHKPKAGGFLALVNLFHGLGKITSITGHEAYQSDLEYVLFGGKPGSSPFFAKSLFFDADEVYDGKKIGEVLMEAARVGKTSTVENLAEKLSKSELRRHFSDSQSSGAFINHLNDNNHAKAKDVHAGLRCLLKYFNEFKDHHIGQLSFKEDPNRTITFEDQMKVFELINQAGTQLTEIELLVVRPAWRQTVDITAHQYLADMIDSCKDDLQLKGPNNQALDLRSIARWQIAACYSAGFKKRFSNRKLDYILG
jgi:hypothetical protein